MLLSFIIITHNEAKRIETCLVSVEENRADNCEIILVDNASTDNTVQIVEQSFHQVRVIKNLKNLGVACARNQGVREAKGKYIMFLDADAELTPGVIERLIEKMEQNPKIGIIAPKLVYPTGELQYSCRRFPTLGNILARGLGSKSEGQENYLMKDYDHQTAREIDWVMGACQLIRREVFDSIGLLDEDYFYGYEDVDFCWRVRRKGWKVVCMPEAVVVHHYQRRSARGGIFNPLKWSHFFSAMRFLIKKNS